MDGTTVSRSFPQLVQAATLEDALRALDQGKLPYNFLEPGTIGNRAVLDRAASLHPTRIRMEDVVAIGSCLGLSTEHARAVGVTLDESLINYGDAYTHIVRNPPVPFGDHAQPADVTADEATDGGGIGGTLYLTRDEVAGRLVTRVSTKQVWEYFDPMFPNTSLVIVYRTGDVDPLTDLLRSGMAEPSMQRFIQHEAPSYLEHLLDKKIRRDAYNRPRLPNTFFEGYAFVLQTDNPKFTRPGLRELKLEYPLPSEICGTVIKIGPKGAFVVASVESPDMWDVPLENYLAAPEEFDLFLKQKDRPQPVHHWKTVLAGRSPKVRMYEQLAAVKGAAVTKLDGTKFVGEHTVVPFKVRKMATEYMLKVDRGVQPGEEHVIYFHQVA